MSRRHPRRVLDLLAGLSRRCRGRSRHSAASVQWGSDSRFGIAWGITAIICGAVLAMGAAIALVTFDGFQRALIDERLLVAATEGYPAVPAVLRRALVVGLGVLLVVLLPALRWVHSLVRSLETRNDDYRAVLSSTLDPFITADAHGTVLSASASVETVLGWKPEELVGRNVSVLVPEPHRSRHDEYLEAYRRTGETWIIGNVRSLSAVRRDGSLFPCELVVSAVQSDKGQSLFAAVIRDLTATKRVEERLEIVAARLRAQNDELARSNRDLDDFAHVASHDLREPLRGIVNDSTFLLEDYADRLDEDGRRKLETLVRLSHRLDVLVADLLKLARIGRGPLSGEAASIEEIIEEVLERLRPMLVDGAIDVRFVGRMPTLVCDRTCVGEIFANLVSNAAKYNDKSEKWIEIGCFGEAGDANGECDEEYVFWVRDNGIGVDEAHQEVIFAAFKRLHGRDKFGGGTGVGLAIVQKLVERHGGRIWMDSARGEGTTFFFTLKAVTRASASAVDAAASLGETPATA